MINLSKNLNKLGVDQNQLIVMAILIGTDYNPDGVKGIGPQKALKLVKEYKTDFNSLFEDVKWKDFFKYGWTDVFYLIKKMSITEDYDLEWKNINTKEIIDLLVIEHDFSNERVEKIFEKISKKDDLKKQKGLKDYF